MFGKSIGNKNRFELSRSALERGTSRPPSFELHFPIRVADNSNWRKWDECECADAPPFISESRNALVWVAQRSGSTCCALCSIGKATCRHVAADSIALFGASPGTCWNRLHRRGVGDPARSSGFPAREGPPSSAWVGLCSADRHAVSTCLAALQGGRAETPFIDQMFGSGYPEPLPHECLGPNSRPHHHIGADPYQRSLRRSVRRSRDMCRDAAMAGRAAHGTRGADVGRQRMTW
jgi:hypothetical protein